MKIHIPVMTDEVIKFITPQKNKNYIDCTVGLGGHSQLILEKIKPKGKLLCIDQNNNSLNEAKANLKKYQKQCIFVNDNFRNLLKIVQDKNFGNISGILYDLGLASWQIDKGGLGISFQKEEPLDMRLAQISNYPIRQAQGRQLPISNKIPNFKYQNITAEEIVNKFPAKKLADILYQYGDVRNSWGVAKRIEIARKIKPIKTTFDLVRVIGFEPNLQNNVKKSNPKLRRVRGCPAPYAVQGKILAPIFQALRIAVNNELENLQKSLEQAIDIIKPCGRIVVICFHSGEDRIAKNIFRMNQCSPSTSSGFIKILTKKPIVPTEEEIKNNPRARSAKFRAVERIM